MYKVSFFHSKYGAKQQVLADHELVYRGTNKDCPPELLGATQNTGEHKFVNIWKPKE